ncbi:unnamed protein product [Penicillium salamii]|uniref:Uncharacterized protein n=1 Tax=Penicillium salamii TaxID=1612424 RepID=A0A9W4NB34_9EURO|nr:unnamed protein product [Penicillium salamii]CAG8004808.1 unnamed protein product [Penicillium salamii]CAG8216141.1 unnamed protein product [Penicillium salamii]CAG8299869.1 unnamed protein product [Penicillium salamii]CAG8325638.1 unnamed protein product [Penicillium salamii]
MYHLPFFFSSLLLFFQFYISFVCSAPTVITKSYPQSTLGVSLDKKSKPSSNTKT